MNLFDLVTVLADHPEEGVGRGSVGTIVHVFDQPRRAHEVEFVDDDGDSVATLTLRPEQIKPA